MSEVAPGALRVAIADPDPGARSRLLDLMGRIGSPPVRVVLDCESASALVDQAVGLSLDAVFADIIMPGGWSLPESEIWGPLRPDFVFLTSLGAYAARAFEVEAIDCLTRPVLEERLRQTLERLWRRRRTAGSPGRADPADNYGALTARQQEILILLGQALTNKEIARVLGLSHFTVRNHVVELFRLFGVSRRGDFVKAAGVRSLNLDSKARRRQAQTPPTFASGVAGDGGSLRCRT